jgi:sugar-specific transcriptional regulator TrmB
MNTRDLLRSLGLTSYEAEVYEALVRLGRAKVQDIARVVSVPRPQIYVALGRLMERGLCGEERGKVSHYTVVPPDTGFSSILAEQEAALKARAEGVKRLAEHYRQAEKPPVSADFVQVLRGGQIGEFMDKLMAEAEKEVLTLFKSAQERDERMLEYAIELETGIIRRGVRTCCVYEEESLANEKILPILERLLECGEEARVVAAVPLNAVIVDSRAALFSLTTEKGAVTVFAVTHPALVETIRQSFQHLWESGRSLAEALRERRAEGGAA